MPLTQEDIQVLEKPRNFPFSSQSLNQVLSLNLQDLIKTIQEKQVPVLHSATELEAFIKEHADFLIVPFLLYKENPEDFLLSTSSMHMNWLWPNLIYVPVNIKSGDNKAIAEIYETALRYEQVVFINHTIPHKSNSVMQQMFGPGQGDYLVRENDTFVIKDGNGRAFVKMASALMGGNDFTDTLVVIIGVGGAGTLGAKAIKEEKPKRLILVDPVDKSELAGELGAEYFSGVEKLPDFKGEKLVIIDATSHYEVGLEKSPALDFVEKHDAEGNVFIDYNMHAEKDDYKHLKTKCGVGSEYVAYTNYFMMLEIVRAAKAIGVSLPEISWENFREIVEESVHTRDTIKEILNLKKIIFKLEKGALKLKKAGRKVKRGALRLKKEALELKKKIFKPEKS